MTAVQPSSYDQYTNDVLSGKTGSDLATDFWKALSDPNTTTTEKSAMMDVLYGTTHGTMDNKTAAAELITAEAAGKLATTPPTTPPATSSYDQFRNDVASGKSGDDLAPDFWKALSDPNTTTIEKGAMWDVIYGQTHHTMDNKTAVAELDKAGQESYDSSDEGKIENAWKDDKFGLGGPKS